MTRSIWLLVRTIDQICSIASAPLELHQAGARHRMDGVAGRVRDEVKMKRVTS